MGVFPPPLLLPENILFCIIGGFILYQSFYDLMLQGIYGNMTLTPDMELTLTFLSTLACLFLVSLPFMIVYRIIRLLCG